MPSSVIKKSTVMEQKPCNPNIIHNNMLNRFIGHDRICKTVSLLVLLTISWGCEKEPIPPEPEFAHEINIDGNVEGASFKVWDNGSALRTQTANAQGDASFLFTDKKQNMSVDSITGTKAGYTKWKVGAQTIGAKKDYVATLDEISQAQEFWVEGQTNAEKIQGWKGGEPILVWNGTPGPYNTNKFSGDLQSLTLDSLVFEGTDKVKHKETNVVLQPNGTTKNVDLDLITYLLKGITLDLIKDTSRNYIVTDAEFISKRLQPNATFTIFSKDGNFEQTITSGTDSKFEMQLPKKGDYGIEIQTAGMHPMMYLIRIDSLENNETIAMINESLSLYNLYQSHMGCKPNDNDTTILEHGGQILNLSKELQENPRFLFLNYIRDDMTGELGESINQEMIDLVVGVRNYVDLYENNFFKKNNLEFTENISNFTNEGVMSVRYMTNTPFQGSGGSTVKEGIVVRTSVGINIKQYESYKQNGSNSIIDVLLKEHTRATSGAFYELWKGDKPSNWTLSGGIQEEFTEDSKKATILYHWHLNKYTSENQLGEGLLSGLVDSRIAKEFNNLGRVQNFINNNSLPDIQQKYLN